ncbi:hypothetical protein PRECH8_27500 [Insulibacter thermoxylanivorax]|uniref:HTH marR-type domain-containing protein n=1 Tax=Insulibacter thermoxylanivorax TaxID=2749268 RepID=A0A916VH68_9BACL|nr:MarR family winged helix-turn-helix transcriptional regulator [Insulibacter thermoxylanivorax]GFR39454.1 hypothetical protein PRECH8_27500 [Insulibacter thermoxylanivorax]
MQSTTMHQLDLIDLISERHLQLRGMIEKQWNQMNDLRISNSEWYIMAKIHERGKTTISRVTKHVGITRQATHKCIKNLETKGIVVISNMENNRKDKCLQLTPRGEQCYHMYVSIKENLARKIADAIGAESFAKLRQLLEADWALEDQEQ